MGNNFGAAISRILRTRWLIPSLLVTVLTLGIVGAVVVTTTSAGCGAANKLGLKSAACVKSNPVAGVTAYPSAKGGFNPSPTSAFPSPIPPAPPYESANPPYESPNTPGTPLGSGGSFSFPPVPGTASGGNAQPVALSCRLPIYVGQPGSGGFVVYPGGSFIADPRSAVAAPSPSPGTPSPTPNQYGPNIQGWWGLSYDAAYKRWLPVPYPWVSPDGSRYAYPQGGDVYVQNLATGTQTELASGRNFSVMTVDSDGVYATSPAGQAGLWFLPFSGEPRQIIATGYWLGESHGFAFGTPTSAVPQGAPTTVQRLDVKTGATTNWYTSQAGANTALLGFDGAGNPVIQANYQTGFALWIAVGPSDLRGISWNYSGDGGYPQGPPIADSHGLWFGTSAGIDLYANGQWYLMATYSGQLAGQCL